MKLNKVLVASDCSEHSKAAIEAAVSLAALSGGKVDVLYVAPRPVDYYPLDEWIWGKEGEEHRLDDRVAQLASERFEAFLATLSTDIRNAIDTRVATGVPYEVIVQSAKDNGYDLIVMGTHGRTGVSRVMLGSVAERVVRMATCPVLTVR